jgi:hypothetical protein
MFTGPMRDYPLPESPAHFDPRRYDWLGSRWIFRAPDLSIPPVPIELPDLHVGFQPSRPGERRDPEADRVPRAA